MKWHVFVAKFSHASFRFLKNLAKLLDALFSGFWLGVMSRKSLEYSDELFYHKTRHYTDDRYNQSGLYKWEKAAVEKHFPKAKSLLLIAAGGGREVLALSKMGFDVDSYECNRTLIEYGNGLLQKNGIRNKIKYLPRNSFPVEIEKYDGIIIGWGAYSLMPGTKNRISFLTGLYPFLKTEAPLMISFLYTGRKSRNDRMIKNVSNFFRFFCNRERTEPGDRLVPEFIHYFTEEEIKNELIQSNYRIIDYYTTEYGCVIAGV